MVSGESHKLVRKPRRFESSSRNDIEVDRYLTFMFLTPLTLPFSYVKMILPTNFLLISGFSSWVSGLLRHGVMAAQGILVPLVRVRISMSQLY